MGGGGTMGEKGDGSRKMAAALAAAALAAFSGSGGPRQGATSTPCFPALLLLAALSYLLQVSAVEVYTPTELAVENGTEAKLPCTFTSTEVISSSASVSWTFQGEGSSSPVSFFYYSNGKAYPGKNTQFNDRSSWAGDLNKKDASINIGNMRFQDNGTYTCDVKNPPDIVVTPGKIKVRVVEKGNLSVFPLTLALGVTSVGILVLVLLIILIVCVVNRKKNSKKHYSGSNSDLIGYLGSYMHNEYLRRQHASYILFQTVLLNAELFPMISSEKQLLQSCEKESAPSLSSVVLHIRT